MSISSLESSSSYSTSSNTNSSLKAPVLGTANGALEYNVWRPAMLTYMMRIGLKEADYAHPIPEWVKINVVLDLHEKKERKEAMDSVMGITTSVSSSSTTTASTTTTGEEMIKKVKEIVKRASQAYSILFNSCPEHMRLLIQSPAIPFGYAYGIWELLEKKYRNTEQDSVGALWQQYTSLSQGESESFADYRARVDSIITLLTHAKQVVPDGLKCHIMTDRLQPQYSNIVLVMKSTKQLIDPTKIDWNDVATFINTQERNMEQMTGPSTEHRAMASFNNNSKQGKLTPINYSLQTCEACGMKGHMKSYRACKKHPEYDPNFKPKSKFKKQQSTSTNAFTNSEQAHIANANKRNKQSQSQVSDSDDDTDSSFSYHRSYAAVVGGNQYVYAVNTQAVDLPLRRLIRPTTTTSSTTTSSSREDSAHAPSNGLVPRRRTRIEDRDDNSQSGPPIPPLTMADEWTLVHSRNRRKQRDVSSALATDAWGLDSMASISLSGNRNLFSSLKRCAPVAIETADGAFITASLVGNIELRLQAINKSTPILVRVPNVYFSERATANLLSLQKMVGKEQGWKFKSTAEGSQVTTKGNNIVNCCTKGNVTLLEHAGAERVLAIPAVHTPANIQSPEAVFLLHCKLGHLPFNKLESICAKQTTRDIGVMKLTPDQIKKAKAVIAECSACREAKDKRLPFGKHGLDVGNAAFEQIHADLYWVNRLDKHGKKITEYGVAMKDPYSTSRWELCLPTKDLVASEVIDTLRFIATQTGIKLKKFHTDGGTEFKPIYTKLDSYCKQNGIVFSNSPKETQQLNGIAERAVGETKTRTNTLLKHAHLSDKYWGLACSHEVYLWNRTHISKYTNVTPFEAMYKKKPHLDNVAVFGCDVEVHVSKKERSSTFDSHISRGIYLGHDALRHSPKILLLPSHKIVVTRYVHYLESKFNNYIAYRNNNMDELGAFESNINITNSADLLDNYEELELDSKDDTSTSNKNTSSSSSAATNDSESETDEDETDDTDYEIEKIIGRRTGKDEQEYEVKWKDFPSSDNTWIPYSLLTKAHGAIREYNQEHARAFLTLVNNDHIKEAEVESIETFQL